VDTEDAGDPWVSPEWGRESVDMSRCCLLIGRCEAGPDEEEDDAGEAANAETVGCLAELDKL
jgi:hypothetical protein